MTSISSKSVVAVAHVLPADVRNHLQALANAGLLRKVFTGYAYQPNRWMERVGQNVDSMFGTRLAACLSRRPEIDGVPSARVRMAWFAEAAGLLLLRRMGSQRLNSAYQDWTQTRLSTVASKDLRPEDKMVVAREFEAKEVFQEAADRGVCRVYQLPIAHYQTVDRIFRRELELYPDRELQESHERSVAPHRIERKKSELALSSQVLVPSLFVKKSLLEAGISEDRIHVLPFGSEAEWIADSAPQKDASLFLHVGQLSIRKGTHRLLRAWKRLGAYRTCQLRLIGSMRLSNRFLLDYQGVYNYAGRIPRQSLRKHYTAASCFVLPSLAEGFAVVVLEALSCGTPVVVSRNSGAEGFISEGVEGLLHDAQDDEQLCEALEWMLAHPRRREEMSQECVKKAKSWTWERYRAEFLTFILDLMSGTERSNRREPGELIAG